jgi:hypothetical protein
VALRVDEDAALFLECFAIWVATVVDPARLVAVDLRIYYFAIFNTGNESVRISFVVRSFFPGDPMARNSIMQVPFEIGSVA